MEGWSKSFLCFILFLFFSLFLFVWFAFVRLFFLISFEGGCRGQRGYGCEQNWGACCEIPKDSINYVKYKIFMKLMKRYKYKK